MLGHPAAANRQKGNRVGTGFSHLVSCDKVLQTPERGARKKVADITATSHRKVLNKDKEL